jgi:V-type H+-transporting ATPase proteolipid subunit
MSVVISEWGQLFYDIDPYSWGYLGVAIALGLSIVGAAWGIFVTYE